MRFPFMGVNVRRPSPAVERLNRRPTQRRLASRRQVGVALVELLALAPHAGAGGEAVVVRATVVATRAVLVLFEQGVDERTHPLPSAFASWT